MPHTSPPSLPDHLEQICDRFEAAWQAACAGGSLPRLEEFLVGIAEPERQLLLTELLAIEAGYRKRLGLSQSTLNLLFGILAVQLNLVTLEDLVSGMENWMEHKDKLLGQILLERGRLSAEQRQMLETKLDAHLREHRNNGKQALRALDAGSTIASVLTSIEDDELQASLSIIAGEPSTCSELPPIEGIRYRKLQPEPFEKGGQGMLFLAEDTELHRQVALKEIRPEYADRPEARLSFVLEAEVTGGLEHPGVVPVHGLGYDANGRPYYAMRFLPGDNLDNAIRRFHEADKQPRNPGERNLALRQQLRRFIDVCNTIAYAHSRGVIHRDLKPKNIMLGKFGETVVVDWGMPKTGVVGKSSESLDVEPPIDPEAAAQVAETLLGMFKGTHGYASPEQEQGRIDLIGPRSDIFSLGATLCVLLTGQSAYRGKDRDERLKKCRHGEFTPPLKIKPDTPPALDAICLKAMAYEPKNRYQSALELAADVEHWLADEPVSAFPEPWKARMARWGRRHRTAVVAAAVFLVSAVVALSIITALIWAANKRLEAARFEADNQRKIAVENYEMSRKQAFESIRLFGTSEIEIASVPALHDARKKQLTTTSEAFGHLLIQNPDDPDLKKQAAQIYRFTANFYRLINETKEAERYYRDGTSQLESLVEKALEHPEQNQLNLADMLRDYASLQIRQGRLQQATEKLNRSLQIVTELRKTDLNRPEFQLTEALAHFNLAGIEYRQAKREDLAKSQKIIARSVDLLQKLVDGTPVAQRGYESLLLASSLTLKAVIERDTGNLAAANETHKRAISLLRGMVDKKANRSMKPI